MRKIYEIAAELCHYDEKWAEEILNYIREAKRRGVDINLEDYSCPMHVLMTSDNCCKCPLAFEGKVDPCGDPSDLYDY